MALDAVDARAIADGLRVRQRVARHDGVAANERVLADAAELVHAGVGADRREILDVHVAAERRRVAENRMAPHVTVVRHVRVGHEQVVIPDGRRPAAAGGAAMDGDEFAEDVVMAHDQTRRLAAVLQILRREDQWTPSARCPCDRQSPSSRRPRSTRRAGSCGQ
jgi:hypothetical protein